MSLMERTLDTVRHLLGDFGLDGRTIAICLMLGLAVHWAVQLFMLSYLSDFRRSRLAGIFHSGCFAKGPAWRERGNALLQGPDESRKPTVAVPHRIVSARRTYTLVGELTSGDLCDLHYAVSEGREYVLKIPRVGGQNSLLAKEARVLGQLIEQSGGDLYGEYLPRHAETFRSGRRRVNAFERRKGFYTAEQIFRRYPLGLDGRHLAWMFKRTLEALGYAHSKGWVHGAVLPPHLMFHAENHGLQLVDWIHAERLNRRLRVVPERFKSWYPPECRERRPATASTDIYLAAKSMVFLAGGDPRGTAMPAQIPDKIRRFLNGCLLESPRMRPQDAWQLHDEFTELLEGVYGPPRYHHLIMV